jgi:hypothetical protein
VWRRRCGPRRSDRHGRKAAVAGGASAQERQGQCATWQPQIIERPLQLAVGDLEGAVRGDRCAERSTAEQLTDERGTGAVGLFDESLDVFEFEA